MLMIFMHLPGVVYSRVFRAAVLSTQPAHSPRLKMTALCRQCWRNCGGKPTSPFKWRILVRSGNCSLGSSISINLADLDSLSFLLYPETLVLCTFVDWEDFHDNYVWTNMCYCFVNLFEIKIKQEVNVVMLYSVWND